MGHKNSNSKDIFIFSGFVKLKIYIAITCAHKIIRCLQVATSWISTKRRVAHLSYVRKLQRFSYENQDSRKLLRGGRKLLRNSEATGDMKAQNSVHSSSPVKAEERFWPAKANGDNKQSNKDMGGNSGSSDTIQEKKGSSGSESVTWPKFIIALTGKEKEDDFMAIKGSKPPLRPKKRAKFIQRSLNLVSPGSWLCDLTQERYEVREKKISKKRPRGLKAMGTMDTDSE